MRVCSVMLVALFSFNLCGQTFTGTELLEKAVNYHDPEGNWETFVGEFKIRFSGPAMADRESIVAIDLPNEQFSVCSEQEGKTQFRGIKKEECRFVNEKDELIVTTVSDKECQRTVMFRDYYTYLYGLPMKLKDPGTRIAPNVMKKKFKGKEYLVLRVTYDEEVGSDVWQFYFDPKTYAMEVYQFFKGSDEKTGEYILLKGEHLINGIRMPKDRAWYYNKDNGYLGADVLLTQ